MGFGPKKIHIEDFGYRGFAEFRGFSSFNLQNQEFPIQRFGELSWNLPGKQIRLWESRDSELSGTSEIFKIGPIAKKLCDFKVGYISDTTLKNLILSFFENQNLGFRKSKF